LNLKAGYKQTDPVTSQLQAHLAVADYFNAADLEHYMILYHMPCHMSQTSHKLDRNYWQIRLLLIICVVLSELQYLT